MESLLVTFANVLSIITIAFSSIMKIPQIMRIVKSGSSVGLSKNALILELASYTTTCMYNYTNGHAPLSYLEYPILILQEYVMIAFVMRYSNHRTHSFLLLLLMFGSVTLAFALGLLNKSILTMLLPLTTPVGGLSKVVQLMEILRRKNADSVSALTWFISVFTNVARIYTIIVDSADFYLLFNFIVSSFLSSTVLVATLYYQKYASSIKTD